MSLIPFILPKQQFNAPTNNPADLYLARLSPPCRRGGIYSLRCAARALTGTEQDIFQTNWGRFTYADTVGLRESLKREYSANTANLILCAYRGVMKEAWLVGHIDHEVYHRVVSVRQIREPNREVGRALAPDEIERLLDVCRSDPRSIGIRDLAMFSVMLGTGMRAGELVAINLEDVDSTGAIRIRGKGNKVRYGYLTEHVYENLSRWLSALGMATGAAFVSILKNGVPTNRRLLTRGLSQVLRKRCEQADVGGISPHDLRRTVATRLLENGNDLSLVAKILGHQNITTTAIYDKRGEDSMRTAMAELDTGDL